MTYQQPLQWQPKGACTIYEATELSGQLSALLRQAKGLQIDLSAVEAVDVSFLQLLLAARKETQAKNIELQLMGHCQPLIDLATSLYCQQELAMEELSV